MKQLIILFTRESFKACFKHTLSLDATFEYFMFGIMMQPKLNAQ